MVISWCTNVGLAEVVDEVAAAEQVDGIGFVAGVATALVRVADAVADQFF